MVTLRLESPVAHVDERDRIAADLVFSVALRGSSSRTRVTLLFEHKSFADPKLLHQLARNLFMRHIDEKFQSIIVPIVVRQYRSTRDEPIQFSDVYEDVEPSDLDRLAAFALNFRCHLIDIYRIDREGFVAGSSIDIVVRAMSIVKRFDKSQWPDLMDRLVYVPENDRRRIFALVVEYISRYNNIQADEILRIETRATEER